MKQAFAVLKLPIFLFLLIVGTNSLSAQDCYQIFLEEGKKAFESFQFETAIKKFEAAKVCSDRPDDSVAEEWIAKAQNGYIDRLQLIASKYLNSEGQRSFQKKEYRLAFRLFQEALKYKEDNKDAQASLENSLPYLSDYQFDMKVAGRFYDPDQIILENGKLVLFGEKGDGKKSLIKLVNTSSGSVEKEFEIAGSPSNYQFSKNQKWLAVEYYDAKKQDVCLTIWDVETKEEITTIDKVYRSDSYNGFDFSENGEKLVYRTQAPILRVFFSTVNNETKSDSTYEMGYALNVFNLASNQTIFSTKAIVDYFSDDPNAGFTLFRREPIRQDLVNEKIEMKFSTEGVLATNNKNFVLHKDQFRIRNNYDFAISPDGSKIAFLEYYSSSSYNPDFNSFNISLNNNKKKPEPSILIGKIHVIDFKKDTTVFTHKSEHLDLPLRFLPFSFGKKSENLIFANINKWNGLEYNIETKEWETTSTSFLKGVSIYNFEKDTLIIDAKNNAHDYFITDNNQVITWVGTNGLTIGYGADEYFEVFDLNLGKKVFQKTFDNDFSHFYDVNTADDLLYFSTFNPNTTKTSINVLDTKLDTIKTLKFDFVPFEYTYLRMSADMKKCAFLTAQGRSIKVWDLVSEKQIREIKCQSQIAEFDFSNDGNYLIIRDKFNFVKIVDLRVLENIYTYFDSYLKQLTAEEKEKIGIDW